MPPVTINTIADAAGVSRNTVSLALRGSPRVAPATRDAVLSVAQRLDYRPNLLARAMATGRSRVIGLAIPRLNFSYMPRFVEAIQEAAFEGGYGVLTCLHHNDAGRFPSAVSWLLDRRVDGLIVHCPAPSTPGAGEELIRRSRLPVVFFGFGRERLPGMTFDLSPRTAGEIAVRRLHALGHAHIGYAGGLEGFFEAERLSGVRTAAEDLGLPPVPTYPGEDSLEGGRAAASHFLADKIRPTAVVGFADPVAVGFIQEVTRQGLRVPEDVAVVGTDDTSLATACQPALSTLRAPVEELGREAVALMLAGDRVQGQKTFGWEWVGRESTTR